MTESSRKSQTGIDPVWLCWFSCLGCLAAYFWACDDRLTASFIASVGIVGMAGYWLGGAVAIGFMLGVAIAGLAAGALASAFGPAFNDLLGTAGALNDIVAACVGVIFMGFVGMLVVEVVWNRLLDGREKIREYNQSFGLTFGAIQGAMLALLIFGAVHVAAPFAKEASFENVTQVKSFGELMRHGVTNTILRVDAGFEDSSVEPLVKRHNPFRKLPSLKRLYPELDTPNVSSTRRS